MYLVFPVFTAKPISSYMYKIYPALLFQRMGIIKSFEDEIKKKIEYEIAPYPLSLFDALGMRKTPKSAIYGCFQSVNATLILQTLLTLSMEDICYITLCGIEEKLSVLFSKNTLDIYADTMVIE